MTAPPVVRRRGIPDPFRYPQWLEGVFAVMWLTWSGVNWMSPESLANRPGLAILNHYLDWLWPWIGFLLFAGHVLTLRYACIVGRAITASIGFLVLVHVVVTVGAANLQPFSPIIILLLTLASIAGILSWRLWRRYA